MDGFDEDEEIVGSQARGSAQLDWERLVKRVVGDGGRRQTDPALLTLVALREQRERIEEQIDATIAWARYRGIPREAIARALGVGNGGNLDTVHPDHLDVLQHLIQAEAGVYADQTPEELAEQHERAASRTRRARWKGPRDRSRSGVVFRLGDTKIDPQLFGIEPKSERR
ncbi:hypothetical protein D7I44_07580 [Gryllotalpicola protaetiae]|uniref:Uncharacterized protein n=2 Tax=Gryllotalpicola protaetiae TaxID=2419771 RepID=A0A387BQZ1_9MICO|nr:hypothetical protein D7I44_07580 [Gryllotalpicola protaetiae]